MVEAHRARALTPDKPVTRGTAENPDTFFQAREAANPFYQQLPAIVAEEMRALRRAHRPVVFSRTNMSAIPQAERVIVIMGSGSHTTAETVKHLLKTGERVGVVIVRMFRPFAAEMLVAVIPSSARKIAVLDRTKEPGSAGEPLYQDVITAFYQMSRTGGYAAPGMPLIIGGRYGLSSKEFTPAMVKAIFDELNRPTPKDRFTVGIVDDVTGSSLAVDEAFDIESPQTVRACSYGLGADGTVGANKNSIKIIGDETDLYAQGYFVYDSKKSGAMTVSHLRFGKRRSMRRT